MVTFLTKLDLKLHTPTTFCESLSQLSDDFALLQTNENEIRNLLLYKKLNVISVLIISVLYYAQSESRWYFIVEPIRLAVFYK